MASVDEKVRRLIALAIDHAASENEARNAALQAAKLIAEHGLLNGGGWRVEARRDELREHEELIRRLQSQLRGAEIHERMLKGTIAVLERKVRELEGAREIPKVKWTDRINPKHRTFIVSKYSGRCAHCNEPYEIGDNIAWAKGRTTFHSDCYEDWLEESA